MGSDKLNKTQITMAEEKKSLINTCKNAFKCLIKRKKDAKESKIDKNLKKDEKNTHKDKVALVLEKLDETKEEKDETREDEAEEENELENFTYKYIKDEPRVSTQSSVDSGIEKGTEGSVTDDLTEKLKNLEVDEIKENVSNLTDKLNDLIVTDVNDKSNLKEEAKDEKKKKKLKTVVITRGPTRINYNEAAHTLTHPYGRQAQNRQVQSQINQQILSGGHVIVNDTKEDNQLLAEAVNIVDQSVKNFCQTSKEEQEFLLAVANDFLVDINYSGDTNPESLICEERTDFEFLTGYSPENLPPQNPIMFYNTDKTLAELNYVPDEYSQMDPFTYPTPPRSETVQSPLSDSLYPGYSDSMSAGTSSPMNADFEEFQQIEQFETPKKANLTYYKNRQKEMASKFSKMECCQEIPSCKEIFQSHMQKLNKADRLNLCLKVAKMDINTAYVVLSYIIMKLSEDTTNEDLPLAVFNIICEKVLSQKPEMFVEDFGLDLLKLAVLRCHARPLLARYLVQCARTALRCKGKGPADTAHIYHELDAQGDNLVHACVRAGDACAGVVAALVAGEPGDVPPFDVHHHNGDGYMPLHLACSLHSASRPLSKTIHVLLVHAKADIWRWDVKGGDTPLHLAVNSATCDVDLVLQLFQHLDRKDWKKMAHARNRSSVTPLDYARSAVRSPSRPHFPKQVLEFLQKCRQP